MGRFYGSIDDLTPKFRSIVSFGPAVSNDRSSRHEEVAIY